MARRLAELTTVFERHAGKQPLGLKRPFGQPNFPHLRTAAWETAMADQSLSHMPRDVRLGYATLYEGIYWFREKSAAETEAWTHMRQVDDQAVMLDQDWAALHQWKIHAQSLAEKVDTGILPRPFFADATESLGVSARSISSRANIRSMMDNFCQPLL